MNSAGWRGAATGWSGQIWSQEEGQDCGRSEGLSDISLGEGGGGRGEMGSDLVNSKQNVVEQEEHRILLNLK